VRGLLTPRAAFPRHELIFYYYSGSGYRSQGIACVGREVKVSVLVSVAGDAVGEVDEEKDSMAGGGDEVVLEGDGDEESSLWNRSVHHKLSGSDGRSWERG
jgi:hypothetical protein